MTEKAKNYLLFKKGIPDDICLVAVSKTKPEEDIMDLYEQGQRVFGENKVQELSDKASHLPGDIQWHMIGHLQTNKVKYIASFVHLIHAVDSLKLLRTINKEALKNERIIDCLLQFHIAAEETKFGLDESEISGILESEEFKTMKNIRITGVMGMASFTKDKLLVRNEFRKLRTIFEKLKAGFFIGEDYFKEISMGMSGDYQIAIEEGASMIRVGSLLFGERNYIK